MNNLKNKYPHWFDVEGNYIDGSVENQRERIKDEMLTAKNEQFFEGTTQIDVAQLRKDLAELEGIDSAAMRQAYPFKLTE